MNKLISTSTFCILTIAFACLISLPLSSTAQKKDKSCCANPTSKSGKETSLTEEGQIEMPSVKLTNQDGEVVNLLELTKGKVVAINFVFTTCTTICPVMGAQFSALTKKMKQELNNDLVMISISIDPVNDTPERLKIWSEKFEPEKGWNLLTGNKHTINKLLKELEVFTALIDDHAPIILMGKEGEGGWIRTNGLTAPEDLAKQLKKYINPTENSPTPTDNKGAASYFTNVTLVNQYGEEMALFDDLMRGKVVIINPFFSECTGTCPVMNSKMEALQAQLGDQLGKSVHILSITVDPKNDTPETLAAYADRFHAKRGWYFLSGEIFRGILRYCLWHLCQVRKTLNDLE